jgi:hypothetical protein
VHCLSSDPSRSVAQCLSYYCEGLTVLLSVLSAEFGCFIRTGLKLSKYTQPYGALTVLRVHEMPGCVGDFFPDIFVYVFM